MHLTMAVGSLFLLETLSAGTARGLRDDMIAAHNEVRRSSGVPPITWSDDLAQEARKWAEHLIASGQFSHRPNNNYGENLYEMDGGTATPSDVVEAWASERRYYNHARNTCSGRCGHYTQVVWRDTTRIGCGVARDRRREVWVCNYEPPGNIIGERPY